MSIKTLRSSMWSAQSAWVTYFWHVTHVHVALWYVTLAGIADHHNQAQFQIW